MGEIIDVTEEQVFQLCGAIEAKIIKAQALVANGSVVIGLGGLAEVKDDPRLWAFLDVMPMNPKNGLKVIRALQNGLRDAGREAAIQCDGDFAERLLTAIGFEKTDEVRKDWRTGEPRRVWTWRP
jgi:hypothetical protein